MVLETWDAYTQHTSQCRSLPYFSFSTQPRDLSEVPQSASSSQTHVIKLSISAAPGHPQQRARGTMGNTNAPAAINVPASREETASGTPACTVHSQSCVVNTSPSLRMIVQLQELLPALHLLFYRPNPGTLAMLR